MFFHDMFWGGLWFAWFFKVLVIVLIVWLFMNAFGKNRSNYKMPLQQPESPLDILKRRYAKGEISKEQFEQMRKDLE
jgi:putative membrane protein